METRVTNGLASISIQWPVIAGIGRLVKHLDASVAAIGINEDAFVKTFSDIMTTVLSEKIDLSRIKVVPQMSIEARIESDHSPYMERLASIFPKVPAYYRDL
jgi:hypothetical protein